MLLWFDCDETRPYKRSRETAGRLISRPPVDPDGTVSNFDCLRGDMKPLLSIPGHILPVWASL